MKEVKINCTLNGKKTSLQAYPMERLLDTLRNQQGLTGTKEGCGEGECGACSVFIDDQLVNSCLVPSLQAQEKKITTIEGLSQNGKKLTKIQKAFLKYGGAQCGICTPGMIMAATELLKRKKNPNKQDIMEALSGNLCRCTGYMKIFESVLKALKMSNT